MNRFYNSVVFLTNELFDEDYTVGQMGLIQWLRDNVGTIVCWVISAVGFMIVAAAIIRNTLAGLYLAYPRLWDRVSKVKSDMENNLASAGGGGGGGGEKLKQKASSLLLLLCTILPDVKSATDFAQKEDGSTDASADSSFSKKKWLTTAIPQFLGLVLIGMLIFYGYPSKLANFVGNIATWGADAVFDNVDPVQLVKKVANGIAVVDLGTDNATSPYEANVNAMVKSAVKQVYTKYSDMQSQPLQSTATEIENNVLSTFNGSDELVTLLNDVDGFEVTSAVQLTSTTPNVNSSFKQVKDGVALYRATSTNGITMYKYYFDTASLPTGSTKVGANDYLVFTISATPKSLAATSAAKLYVLVPGNTVPSGTLDTDSTGKVKYTFTSNIVFNTAGGVFIRSGAKVTIQMLDDSGNIKESVDGTFMSDKGSAKIVMSQNSWTSALNRAGTYKTVRILLPSGSYVSHARTDSNGVTINTSITCAALVLSTQNVESSDTYFALEYKWNEARTHLSDAKTSTSWVLKDTAELTKMLEEYGKSKTSEE